MKGKKIDEKYKTATIAIAATDNRRNEKTNKNK